MASLLVLKLGQKLLPLRRYDRSQFFTKNLLMHHAQIQRREAATTPCNIFELFYCYSKGPFNKTKLYKNISLTELMK
jgi:hypothetical protein